MTAATTLPPGRTLGVLGGMGPAATAEFLRLLATDVPASRDQEHPRIVMLSDPTVPDRTAAILGDDTEAARRIRKHLFTLVEWGADLLAIPCNTAHALLDDIASELPAPLVDIVDATLDEAVRLSPEGGWLTATTGTVASGLYQKRAATRGYPLHVPGDAEQERVHAAAGLVKAGRTDEAADGFQDVVESLWRRRSLPVLAACTELPLAHRASALPPESMVSSLQALSRACVAALL
ncbi:MULTISPECIES: aspartate/glutamate racemase family protein [Streptomyces]|uniref:aspartate/glutamate racemase family protein n=1 Tax=Streptomyces TaxID=1883 RepID=UPI00093BDEED|nr:MULTISPECIES: amino acid racemase [Streptomyces]MBX9422312.1 amino acid racemase [Streptomyces lateritius]OKJ60619.1 aspartate racemase [Streptomyces sp. CB02261]